MGLGVGLGVRHLWQRDRTPQSQGADLVKRIMPLIVLLLSSAAQAQNFKSDIPYADPADKRQVLDRLPDDPATRELFTFLDRKQAFHRSSVLSRESCA